MRQSGLLLMCGPYFMACVTAASANEQIMMQAGSKSAPSVVVAVERDATPRTIAVRTMRVGVAGARIDVTPEYYERYEEGAQLRKAKRQHTNSNDEEAEGFDLSQSPARHIDAALHELDDPLAVPARFHDDEAIDLRDEDC